MQRASDSGGLADGSCVHASRPDKVPVDSLLLTSSVTGDSPRTIEPIGLCDNTPAVGHPNCIEPLQLRSAGVERVPVARRQPRLASADHTSRARWMRLVRVDVTSEETAVERSHLWKPYSKRQASISLGETKTTEWARSSTYNPYETSPSQAESEHTRNIPIVIIRT